MRKVPITCLFLQAQVQVRRHRFLRIGVLRGNTAARVHHRGHRNDEALFDSGNDNASLVQALMHAPRMDAVDDLAGVVGKILVSDVSHRNLYKIAVGRNLKAYVAPTASGYRNTFLDHSVQLVKPPLALVRSQLYRLLDTESGQEFLQLLLPVRSSF